MGVLQVRNWDKWQTYRKDRSTPPWIKVHRRLLLDPQWNSLTDSQKGQLISVWLLAADRNGAVPDDAKMLRKLCQLDHDPDIECFVSLGFLERLMTTKKRKHGNQVTTKTETHVGLEESRVEADKRQSRGEGGAVTPPTLNTEAWESYLTYRRENSMKALKSISAGKLMLWLTEQGGSEVQRSIVEQSMRNGWTGLFAPKEGKHGQPATKSRAKRVSDKLDEIAKRDIEENGLAETLGGRDLQAATG